MKKGEILDKVYKSNLASRGKQIMFYLINRSNTEGTCFPSVRTIAGDCSLSERTIQRTMKVLLEEGFVIKEKRYRVNGGQSSNLYKLQTEPEKNIDNQFIKGNKGETENDVIESIEVASFDDYTEECESKKTSLNGENQTACGILVQRIPLVDDNFIKGTKCYPIIFQFKDQTYNNLKVKKPLNVPCHRAGDNLNPP